MKRLYSIILMMFFTTISFGQVWVAYHNYATFSIDDNITRKAHWLESATAILTETGWKLEMMHSTRLP